MLNKLKEFIFGKSYPPIEDYMDKDFDQIAKELQKDRQTVVMLAGDKYLVTVYRASSWGHTGVKWTKINE